MTKILIVSHSPYSTTGYGRVVRALAGSLKNAGYDIVCLGTGSKDAKTSLDYPFIPWKGMSAKAIGEALTSQRSDVLLTIGDPWMFEGVPALREREWTTWLAYFPVDGYPLPASWKRWAQAVDVPVVFSKFARDVVQAATGTAPALIYHGVDTRAFCPGDRQRAKELARLAGHFVVGTVARNQMRKNIPALIKAFARFAQGKDDVLLYLHTQLKGDFDIAELVRNAGLTKKTRVTGEIKADRGVADELLATVYRAMDVFVLPTMAEGFGLPIMESQACGTPALVTDFSACPELVPDPIQRLKVKETLTMARNFEQAIVDVDDIVEKLELLYRDRNRLKALGETCAEFAKSFEWEIAYRQFNELLTSPRFTALASEKKSRQDGKTAANATGPFSQSLIGNSENGGNVPLRTAADTVAVAKPQVPISESFDEVNELYSQATAKMKSGEMEAAEPLMRKVVQLRPSNPDFQNELGLILHAVGKLPEAIACFQLSLKLRPARDFVWTNLGRTFLAAGDTAEAVIACDNALRISPELREARDLRNAIRLKGDNSHGAINSDAELTEANARQRLDEVVARIDEYPGGFEGRGIVIVGGGARYFPCAWVCIRMLSEVGCVLPIELWHLGEQEMTPQMRGLVEKYDVTCVDGRLKGIAHGFPDLGGWELKPFSITHSRFREVLLLDADNFPLVDPGFLFETPEYLECGAVFWPDYSVLEPADRVWELTGVPYKRESAFESGQVVIDKRRCWKALSVTMWFNQFSEFWYRYFFGDKDTFHLAWRKLGQTYAMPAHPPSNLPYAIGQPDFTGRRIFQHRNRAKWVLMGGNARMKEFEKEDRGFAFLEELRRVWNPVIPVYNLSATERIQLAWRHYAETGKEAEGLLSAAVGDVIAWREIGRVAKHTANCIADAHTVRILEAAIRCSPQIAELHAMLGTTMGLMGRHDKAVESFRQAKYLFANLNGLEDNLSLAGRAAADCLPE